METQNELADGCVACGPGVPFLAHRITEGMFATGESFDYHECERCGTLQISSVPDNLASYYDTGTYYSFSALRGRLDRRWLRTRPARAALRVNTEIYLRTGRGYGFPWAREAGIQPSDRLLDLGCGSGEALYKLWLYGYQRLTGSDPFLPRDTQIAPGVQLVRAYHWDVTGEFDWITMHHAFEHVADPRATLRSARRLLGAEGRVLVRIPLMGQFAWRHYGTSWAQIDPPRHLVLYTLPGIRKMADEEGFEVDQVFFDSTCFQFWASERVREGKPHAGAQGEFPTEQIDAWEAEAQRLNRAQDGDQVGIVLRPR
jgi:SAM-dependent methyltransferase